MKNKKILRWALLMISLSFLMVFTKKVCEINSPENISFIMWGLGWMSSFVYDEIMQS